MLQKETFGHGPRQAFYTMKYFVGLISWLFFYFFFHRYMRICLYTSIYISIHIYNYTTWKLLRLSVYLSICLSKSGTGAAAIGRPNLDDQPLLRVSIDLGPGLGRDQARLPMNSIYYRNYNYCYCWLLLTRDSSDS
jgi:hypothetical protein